MCREVGLAEESHVGLAFELCREFSIHLPYDLLSIRDQPDPSVSETEDPLANTLEGFGASTLAIIEWDYFDLDYRSEFSLTHETTFAARDPEASRLHFFAPGDVPQGASLYELVEQASDTYRGYVVLRPVVRGAVGRCLVGIDGVNELLGSSELGVSRVRTAVTETVTLFGLPLSVVGVPFMEQDGHLLRCVHVAGWIAHYSAVLRGLVARRASAEFHLAEQGSDASLGRMYPSLGLSTLTMSRIMDRVGMPCHVLEFAELVEPREPSWYDREEIWARSAEYHRLKRDLLAQPATTEPDSTLEDLEQSWQDFWTLENLTATTCRYLNSGFPVVFCNHYMGHTEVACGYLRQQDVLALGDTYGSNSGTPGRIQGFFVQDDERGPYSVTTTAELLEDFKKEDLTLLVPLPPRLWLAGNDAERMGAVVLRTAIRLRTGQHPTVLPGHSTPEPDGASEAALSAIHDALHDGEEYRRGATPYALRAYAMEGSDFKRGFIGRVKSLPLIQSIGYRPLPKFVWVVEMIDRELRDQGDPRFVRATTVLDASVPVDESSDLAATLGATCIVEIPGQVWSELSPMANTLEFGEDASWVATGVKDPYESGRWSHHHEWQQAAGSVARRSKTAGR